MHYLFSEEYWIEYIITIEFFDKPMITVTRTYDTPYNLMVEEMIKEKYQARGEKVKEVYTKKGFIEKKKLSA